MINNRGYGYRSRLGRLLIVEDERVLREAYAYVLQRAGYEVQTAADGQKALNRLRALSPDLILLDMLMPIMNGLEFLQKASLEKNYIGVKVIVFSNLSHSDLLPKMYEQGIQKHVLKANLSPRQLVELVGQQLEVDTRSLVKS